MARVYLQASDPKAVTRTWQYVMDQIIAAKQGDTQHRGKTEAKSKAYDCIRDVLLVETQAEHFLRVLTSPKVSTNVHLLRIHNFALDMNWLGCPVISDRRGEDGRLVDEVKSAAKAFDAWFREQGGSLNNFRESINEVANSGPPSIQFFAESQW